MCPRVPVLNALQALQLCTRQRTVEFVLDAHPLGRVLAHRHSSRYSTLLVLGLGLGFLTIEHNPNAVHTQTHGIVGVLTTKLKRSIHCVCKMLTVKKKGCFIQSISYLIITVPHPRIINLGLTNEITQFQPALPCRCCDLHQINK